MRLSAVYIAGLSTLLLSGCATQWYKPGATKADGEQALSACQIEAYNRIPVRTVYRMEAGETQRTRSCDKHECTETTTFKPPQQVSEDANSGIRRQYIRACMFRHGWTDEKPDK